MTPEQFQILLSDPATPQDLPPALMALWWDRRGDWQRAHECAQADDGRDAATVHAYLHRKEGDLPNARYWYERAGSPVATGGLDGEWAGLVERFASA